MLQDLREETEEKRRGMSQQLNKGISDNAAGIASLREDHRAAVERLAAAEGHISTLTNRADKLHEVQTMSRKRQEDVVIVTLNSLGDQLVQLNASAKSMQQDLQALDG